ncbi:hypothetical protein [Paraburkholderia panacisoli]|uniref:hypothetical protein n=1 Tax=Paraburkholderia panacisoli TaxID=2603818 RepID=UPI00165F0291|nr:hypothetical protein [Paraburkholderia panacisoli]
MTVVIAATSAFHLKAVRQVHNANLRTGCAMHARWPWKRHWCRPDARQKPVMEAS